MGPLSIAGMAASTVLNFAGSMRQAAGVRAQAAAKERLAAQQREAAEFEAGQYETNAMQSVAAAQRVAHEERRQATRAASRVLAVAAASGAGASDPTVINLMARTAGEGAYRAATAMWDGEDRARKMRDAAAVARYTGEARGRLSEDQASALSSQASAVKFSGYTSLLGNMATGSASLIRSGVIKI